MQLQEIVINEGFRGIVAEMKETNRLLTILATALDRVASAHPVPVQPFGRPPSVSWGLPDITVMKSDSVGATQFDR